jgi:hypothetical protein
MSSGLYEDAGSRTSANQVKNQSKFVVASAFVIGQIGTALSTISESRDISEPFLADDFFQN